MVISYLVYRAAVRVPRLLSGDTKTPRGRFDGRGAQGGLEAADVDAALEAAERLQLVVELRQVEAVEHPQLARVVEAALADDHVRDAVAVDVADRHADAAQEVPAEGEELLLEGSVERVKDADVRAAGAGRADHHVDR